MHGGRRRSAARLLAPLALVVAVVAVLLVVQASMDSNKSKDDSVKTPTAQGTTSETTQPARPVRPTYTVKLNDTLVLISEKTGVSVERIETLNPDLDPQNLIVGQKIKLRE